MNKMERMLLWIHSTRPILWINTNYWYFKKVTWPKHPWVQHYRIKQEIIKLEWDSCDICDDPMNGCPGDFAEDYYRRIRRLQMIEDGLQTPRFINGLMDYFLQAYEDRREAQYNDLPWV